MRLILLLNMITEKRCTKCGIVKPLDEFTKAKNRKDGYYCYCKTCSRENARLHNRNKVIENNDEALNKTLIENPIKQCSKCGIIKPIQLFRINRQMIGGYNCQCKECEHEDYRKHLITDEQLRIIEAKKPYKYCPMCEETKPIREFPIYKQSSDGHTTLCTDCNRKRNKERYQRGIKVRKNYRHSHKRETSEYNRNMGEQTKRDVMTHYGNGECKCVLCGYNDIRALSIDHINGGGRKHRLSLNMNGGGGINFYKWLIKEDYPEGYRTLCLNCQSIVESEKRCQKLLLQST